MSSQAQDRSIILDEANIGGLGGEKFIHDKANNRYYYDVTKIHDAFLSEKDGHSIVYFGFKTHDPVPVHDDVVVEEDPF